MAVLSEIELKAAIYFLINIFLRYRECFQVASIKFTVLSGSDFSVHVILFHLHKHNI